MDIQNILAIVFLAVLIIFLYIERKKLETQKILFPIFYFILYKTKLGIKYMDSLAKKWPRAINVLSYLGIIFGFIGMALISFELIRSLVTMFKHPQNAAAVALVLPFETSFKGTIAVPFFYWIISIFLIATVHEFSHGVVARLNKVKINSSGFAFLSVIIPIIPAAFVEPDEKQMSKKSVKTQLGVLAAGPFSNILFALIIFLVITFLMAPLVNSMVVYDGVKIVDITKGASNSNIIYPAELAGMQSGEIINSLDGTQINYVTNFTYLMEGKTAGDTLLISTNINSYNVTLAENPGNSTKGFLGVSAEQSYSPKSGISQNYPWVFPIVMWFSGLFTWLFILNLGIGLFNLVPLGPIDGGRMVSVILTKWFGKKTGGRLWGIISFIFLAVLVALFLMAFLK